MAKKEQCKECPFSPPTRDRSVIAKIGHINREINTNNRLSDKSIERLKMILRDKDSEGGFSGPDDFFENIITKIEKARNFDELNDEEKFWVYEIMEWTTYGMVNIDPETF